MRPYDERLDQFLSRAAKVFADQGYHSTTMRDLAAATGMSLAGMYYYVRGKEELLYRIQDRCFARVLAGAERALTGLADADALERLHAVIRHHVTFFAAHMAEMKVLSHDAGPRGGARHVARRNVLLRAGQGGAAVPHPGSLFRARAGRRRACADGIGRRGRARAVARVHPPPRHLFRRAHGRDEGLVARGELPHG